MSTNIFLTLHPYGTEAEQKHQRDTGEVQNWQFTEVELYQPYESAFEYLTTPLDHSKGGPGKSTKTLNGGMVSSVGERTALLPLTSRPGQPYSVEAEREEIRKIEAADKKVVEMLAQQETEKAAAEADKAKAIADLRAMDTKD